MRNLSILVSCLALLAIASLPLRTHAQSAIHECTGASGEVLYSDKPCAAFGAADRGVPHTPPSGATMSLGRQAVRAGCAHTLDDLVHEITLAFDTSDPNRLVGVYHWPGLGTESGYDIADRLASLTRNHQLLDTQLSTGAVRLVLAQGKGNATTSTNFHLRRHENCWWISY
ncbi:DUF4124 domain-containing protein [Solilutibacter silvestris]|uniref:DUF4124 domain-containing protein n=1 Tax=Solilutibacter silvestris TaxID=1645665 RepID=A0A2K1PX63_9GAMM|nr:DUF4124 domain-containing protein [Lysobacter silvestris]PNS07390.1 hypothetical protein Lysil_1566 [Lysobacter silvestris]